MIKILTFKGLPIIILVFLYIMYFLFILRKKGLTGYQYLLHLLFFIYLLMAIDVTLFPIPFDQRLVAIHKKLGLQELNNFIPLHTIYQIIKSVKVMGLSVIFTQILGNICLGGPFGFLLPLMHSKINNTKKTLAAGFLFGLSIECWQKVISFMIHYSYRSFDVDDIILNFIGVILGYSVLRICLPLIKNILDVDHLNKISVPNISK